MTLIELFPFFIAVSIAVLSGVFLTKAIGLSDISAGIIAITLGIASWILYGLALGKLVSWLQQRKTNIEKREKDC